VTKRQLGGGFKHFVSSSLLGEMIQFDEHIFQMGRKPPTRQHCSLEIHGPAGGFEKKPWKLIHFHLGGVNLLKPMSF